MAIGDIPLWQNRPGFSYGEEFNANRLTQLEAKLDELLKIANDRVWLQRQGSQNWGIKPGEFIPATRTVARLGNEFKMAIIIGAIAGSAVTAFIMWIT